MEVLKQKKSITSASQFRKILKVGDSVRVTYHIKPNGFDLDTNKAFYRDEVRPVRQVSAKNSSHFILATFRNGQWEGRKIDFPKAAECEVEDGIITIYGPDIDNADETRIIQWLSIEIV